MLYGHFRASVTCSMNVIILILVVVVIEWLCVQLKINWSELFMNKNCPSPMDEDNLKFRDNEPYN